MKKIDEPNSKFADITQWNTSPHVLLCDHLIGCIEQCPFCGEQCELTDSEHVKSGKDHYIEIHRPECLGRYTWHTSKKLVLDSCEPLIDNGASFRNRDTGGRWIPYKQYKTIYKDWCIINDHPTEAPKYWQWFIHRYLNDITKWVGAAATSVDHFNWGKVSEEMAMASLGEVYKNT